jgi:hypothetical protein
MRKRSGLEHRRPAAMAQAPAAGSPPANAQQFHGGSVSHQRLYIHTPFITPSATPLLPTPDTSRRPPRSYRHITHTPASCERQYDTRAGSYPPVHGIFCTVCCVHDSPFLLWPPGALRERGVDKASQQPALPRRRARPATSGTRGGQRRRCVAAPAAARATRGRQRGQPVSCAASAAHASPSLRAVATQRPATPRPRGHPNTISLAAAAAAAPPTADARLRTRHNRPRCPLGRAPGPRLQRNVPQRRQQRRTERKQRRDPQQQRQQQRGRVVRCARLAGPRSRGIHRGGLRIRGKPYRQPGAARGRRA